MATPVRHLKTPFGKAIVVTTQTFLDTILPPLPPNIEDMSFFIESIKHVKAPRYRLVAQEGKVLCGYGSYRPSTASRSKAYRPLQHAAEKIVLQQKNLKQSTWFVENTKRQWNLDSRTSDALPDAYLVTSPPSCSKAAVSWSSIAVSGVYHQKDTEITCEENIVKLTRCMSNCMLRDPRRRFTLGFAIESEHMTLWYCDRVQFVTSDPFNFISDPKSTLHFLLSCIYAPDYSLGFDPSMTRVSTGEHPQYDITVRQQSGEERVYRTLVALGCSGDQYLFGRGTRVWTARELKEGELVGEPIALKDCWVDDHRQREGAMYANIRDVGESKGEEDVLINCLLTVLVHGEVYVAGHLDQVPVRDPQIPWFMIRPRQPRPPTAKSQVHYRIVFKEVGDPLHTTASLARVYRSLGEVCKGLKGIHRCGWVHGDVSAANILLFGDATKLCDFEYAAQKENLPVHDGTATRYYMPVEVEHYRHLFTPRYDSIDAMIQNPTAGEASPPLRPHPLHDLESLWWIAVYYSVAKSVVDPENDARESRQIKQRELSDDLFWSAEKRRDAMTNASWFSRQSEKCLEPPLLEFARKLHHVRAVLCDAYRLAERHPDVIPFDVDDSVYEALSSCLEFIATQSSSQGICFEDLASRRQ